MIYWPKIVLLNHTYSYIAFYVLIAWHFPEDILNNQILWWHLADENKCHDVSDMTMPFTLHIPAAIEEMSNIPYTFVYSVTKLLSLYRVHFSYLSIVTVGYKKLDPLFFLNNLLNIQRRTPKPPAMCFYWAVRHFNFLDLFALLSTLTYLERCES